jgi:anti-sigma factor RsiW
MKRLCDRVKALLPYHADGEVSEADARAIREHLSGCAECRQAAAEWRALNRIVDEGLRLEEPVSADEVEAAIRAVHQAKPLWQAAPAPVRFWRSWSPVAGLAALALIIAIAGLNLPQLSLAGASAAIRDETAALALAPGELATQVPHDYQALRRSARFWPEQTVDALVSQWSRGAQLSQALTRRVGVVPLAACALLLLAANFAFARQVRSAHGRLQRG